MIPLKAMTSVEAATTKKPTTLTPTTVKPTTKKPTTMKPTTMKPTDATTPEPITDATTFNPETETNINPETTTFEPFTGSPATDYCNINTCSVPNDNTLCKYTVDIIQFNN